MKKFIFLVILILVPIGISAQNKIYFAYDSIGNRTSKTIVLSKSTILQNTEPLKEIIGKREMKIYPNPTKGMLQIEIPDYENLKNGVITVYNVQGKLITQKKIDSFKNTIDLSSVSNGLYIMQINAGKEISSWKIIKE